MFWKRYLRLTNRNEKKSPIKRALGMNISQMGAFFEILEIKTIELVLLSKPERIFNAMNGPYR
jgi:hypothetical protein